jgi:hypothetical protein
MKIKVFILVKSKNDCFRFHGTSFLANLKRRERSESNPAAVRLIRKVLRKFQKGWPCVSATSRLVTDGNLSNNLSV